MNLPLKKGMTGPDVLHLQNMLILLAYAITADGIFGNGTEGAVINFQRRSNLVVDGIVGQMTKQAIDNKISDLNKTKFEQYPLSAGRMVKNSKGGEDWVANYRTDQKNPEWAFLHHTAGNCNPYKTIDIWDDDIKAVATKFAIGGQSLTGETEYDGKVLDCLPRGAWGAHLTVGPTVVHRESIGIEICNYGGLTKGGFYSIDNATKKAFWVPKRGDKIYNAYGTEMPDNQICDLGETYRFNQYFHKYTVAQIESTREVLLHLKEVYGIDIASGLKTLIQTKGVKAAFEYMPDYINKNKGLYTHGNIFKGKNDIFPQKEMVEMIVSL